MLPGVRNQLIDDEPHENCAVGRKLYFFGRIEYDLARRDRRFQVADDLTQIFGQIDVLVVGIVGKALVGASDRIDADLPPR